MTRRHAIDVRRLPPPARKLVAAIGVESTIRLLSIRGGARLCVPHDPARSHTLTPALGVEAVTALVKVFGGGTWVDLPMPDKLLNQIRDAQIRAEHAEGDSLMTLAGRYSLTTRHIQNIIRDERAASDRQSPQAALF